jgi:inner membrane protein
VENLTHSLLGAVLAEAALPASATPAQRRAFYVTGIVAANLPDADLLYTSITPAPLGYLLHHRGHTHTIVGLIGLAVLVAVVTALPAIRRHIAPVAGRFWILVCCALASHLIADGWNSYGVHPFYPADNRWFYGDAVNIYEPWLWVLLGTSVAMNARSRTGRMLLTALLAAVLLAAAGLGMIVRLTLVPIVIVSGLMIVTLVRRAPSTRAMASLGMVGLFVGASYLTNSLAQSAALSSRASAAPVVDLVLTPKAGNLLCWNALLIEREGDTLAMRRANVPVGAIAPFSCRSRVTDWSLVARQSITDLQKALADCRSRAWMQFGRAPVVRDGWIADARFGDPVLRNFTRMTVSPVQDARACPRNLTQWTFPRADVLLREH